MKYMLLMSATKEVFEWYSKWPKEDLQANITFMRNFNKELKESGVLVGTAGLAFPEQAKMVHAGKKGEPITDGVFPESKEFLAGYWIIEVSHHVIRIFLQHCFDKGHRCRLVLQIRDGHCSFPLFFGGQRAFGLLSVELR